MDLTTISSLPILDLSTFDLVMNPLSYPHSLSFVPQYPFVLYQVAFLSFIHSFPLSFHNQPTNYSRPITSLKSKCTLSDSNLTLRQKKSRNNCYTLSLSLPCFLSSQFYPHFLALLRIRLFTSFSKTLSSLTFNKVSPLINMLAFTQTGRDETCCL